MFGFQSFNPITRLCKHKNCNIHNFILTTFSTIINRSNNFNLNHFKYYSNSSNDPVKDNFNWRKRVVGAQTGNRLNVGPYKRGRWFVSYKEDPVTGYAIFTLLPGESMKVRRQRKLRQMLLDKANLTESELNYIENYKLEYEDKQNSN